jgi:diguanylate cyclase (GGDEF)-like protein
MDLIGDLGTRETGFVLVLFGTTLLAIVFAAQTWMLSRQLRRQAEQSRQLEAIAFNDPLTGLANRRLLFDRLQRSLHAAQRNRNVTAVYFLDLDNFKTINDRFGHDAGDEVLRGMAQRWTSHFRAVDTVARWGGDEFVIITEGIDTAADVRSVVARLRRATSEPFMLEGEPVVIEISIGVAVGCRGSDNPEALIRCADAAMYRAKRSGEAPHYEVVGQRECIEMLSGFAADRARNPDPEAEFVRVLAD